MLRESVTSFRSLLLVLSIHVSSLILMDTRPEALLITFYLPADGMNILDRSLTNWDKLYVFVHLCDKTNDLNEAETKRTGSVADEPYVSKWFAYQPLNFLGDKNKRRKTQDSTKRKEGHNMFYLLCWKVTWRKTPEKERKDEEASRLHIPNEDGPQDSQEEGIDDDSQVVHPQNSEDEQASTLSPSEVAGTKKPLKSPKALRIISARHRLMASPGSSNALDEALNVMRSLQSKIANIDDEYSLYGEQIAIKLNAFFTQNQVSCAE
ncbi:hypothetical protein WA026_012692 [Henosepilachna vigintioctopunctata]|uniref:No apical meristem-associated C-terminal domain-containing protein n=1 Tax=Henosepilachna vigintioctopunctata TaxID=420089 RepID=A0AAW1U6Y2_9CUCU